MFSFFTKVISCNETTELNMTLICGVDGCKGGWVAITKNLGNGRISWRLCLTARDIFYPKIQPQVIAIDIPIGLPESGARCCDKKARRLLGPGHGSSVFPAPLRAVLEVDNYADACRIRSSIDGKKMSRQAYNILCKIKEVDETLRLDPELQTRVHEVHPEVCFYHLAGRHPMQHNKKRVAGRVERIELLKPHFDHWLGDALAQHRQLESGEDDILDALAALWTAERIMNGTSVTLPPDSPTDSCGLRMEIVA
jgi:predicted RNase H-like nuclease